MMKAICVLFFAITITAVMAEQVSPVELVLSTTQTKYEIGDPIPITLLIRVKDPSLSLECSQDFIRNFYGNFTVIGPDGVKLRRLSDVEFRVSTDAEWMTVSSNPSVIRSVDLTEIYTEPYYISEPHTMTEKGIYNVSYHAEIAVRNVGGSSVLWAGPISSASLNIQIIEMDSHSLQLAHQVLSETGINKSQKIRALTKIQYSNTPLTMNEYDLLRRTFELPDQEIKMKVIRVLGAKPSDDGFEAIAGVLTTENDPILRSEAIAALGLYSKPEALKLILEECQSRKERSYRAAVVVLGAIGNESCIGVLQEIAKSDDTEWVRKRALESIEKIKERSNPKQ